MDNQSRVCAVLRARCSQRMLTLLPLVAVVLAAGCGDSPGDSSSDAPPPASQSPGHGPAASARGEGRRACRGLTPLEAADRFKAAAREAGVKKRFVELVAEPAPSVAASPGYPRLVGALYATTVPPPRREQAAAGCAEELAAH